MNKVKMVALLVLLSVGFFSLLTNQPKEALCLGEGQCAVNDGLGENEKVIKDEEADGNGCFSILSPDGQAITRAYIKTGSQMGDEKCLKYVANDPDGLCYSVNGIGTDSVTICARENDKESTGSAKCQDISHIEGVFGGVDDVTPTPTPADDLTPTPTVEPTVEPTVAPTITEVPQPTATPQPSNDSGGTGGTSSSDNSSSSSTNTETKQGQVLGASTLAATGGFTDSLAALSQILGVAIMALGKVIYARKK